MGHHRGRMMTVVAFHHILDAPYTSLRYFIHAFRHFPPSAATHSAAPSTIASPCISWVLLPALALLITFFTLSSTSSQLSVGNGSIAQPKCLEISFNCSQPFLLLMKDTATPTFPNRPVRPIRWRYVSGSAAPLRASGIS